MTIFKIGNTTPFLFEQNINDLSFGSHLTDAAGRKLHSVWQKSGEDMRQDNSQ